MAKVSIGLGGFQILGWFIVALCSLCVKDLKMKPEPIVMSIGYTS